MTGPRSHEPSERARGAVEPVRRAGSSEPGFVAGSLPELATAVQACRRCDLWRRATQGVPGEGRPHAPLMLIGEQPGDQEDLTGRPFVGPAGRVLDRALAAAGVERADCWVTNAVKHFKFQPRGKRRLHAKPDAGEIAACRWWLDQELELVRPRAVVAMGATAGRALFGRPVTISRARGRPVPFRGEAAAFLTVHPSYLLRLPEPEDRERAFAQLVDDLRTVRDTLWG